LSTRHPFIDSALPFRVHSTVKKNIEGIAAHEGRSVAPIRDAFLKSRPEMYPNSGPKYLQRFLSRQKKEPSE
jgi:hypothetical protein